jgi:hypothetical protein
MVSNFGGRVRGNTEDGKSYDEGAHFFIGGEPWGFHRINRLLLVKRLTDDMKIYCRLGGGIERAGVDDIVNCLLGHFEKIYVGFNEGDFRSYLQDSIRQYRDEAY